MKTPEDEAFDEIAKRQGGFQAKRAMAADKLQEPVTKREALKLALEALELNNDEWKSLADSGDAGVWKAEDQDHYRQTNDAITAIKAALAQPEQEPVALVIDGVLVKSALPEKYTGHLYTTPPQREPLTDEAVLDIADYCLCDGGKTYGVLDFARAIEAAHGIKE